MKTLVHQAEDKGSQIRSDETRQRRASRQQYAGLASPCREKKPMPDAPDQSALLQREEDDTADSHQVLCILLKAISNQVGTRHDRHRVTS